MMNEIKDNKIPPSLDLVFDWVKDVLCDQVNDARHLLGRQTTIFSVATGILGFAIPLILTQLKVNYLYLLPIAIIYLLLSLATIFSLIPIEIDDLRNPIMLRQEDFWGFEQLNFKMEILTHMEDAYTDNRHKIVFRGRCILASLLLLFLEVVAIGLLILFARIA